MTSVYGALNPNPVPHNVTNIDIVASELKDPIWHSLEWQIGSFSSEATIYKAEKGVTAFL